MRNLKRVLSLALALVMVLGMMVIGTSAADFTDAEEITYTEAVEVMSALGILKGYEAANGTFSFNPTGTLNRQEAAKIIAFVCLGIEADDYLIGSTKSFDDVDAAHWAAKYIAFCKNAKIINGVNDAQTLFNPTGTLTTVQFAKMLLGALGIEGSFTGEGWEDNVKAAVAKVTTMAATGIKIDNTDITREEACELALAAMKAPTSLSKGWYYEGAVETLGYFETYTDAYLAAKAVIEVGFDAENIKKDAGDTLLKEAYGVTFDSDDTDAFGRPAVSYKNAVTGLSMIYANDPVATYNSGFNAVEAAKYTFATDSVLVNGVAPNTPITIDDLADRAYTGVSIELYNTDTDKAIEVVVMTQGYLTKVKDVKSDATVASGNYVELEIYNPWEVIGTDGAEANDVKVIKYNDSVVPTDVTVYDKLAGKVAKNDYVITYWKAGSTLSANYIAYEAVTATELAQLTAVKLDEAFSGTITVGGKTYTMASAYAEYTGIGGALTLGDKYSLYVDSYGCVIGAAGEADALPQYAVLTQLAKVEPHSDNSIGSANNDYLQAELVFFDGTKSIVTVAAVTVGETEYDVDTLNVAGVAKNVVVAYAVDEDGEYALTTLTPDVTESDKTLAATALFADDSVANNNTKFIIRTGAGNKVSPYKYAVVTGYANLPTKTFVANTVDVSGIYAANSTVAGYVFVTGTEVNTTSDDTVAFITGEPTHIYVNASTSYYEYPAIIDGAATVLNVANNTTVAAGKLYVVNTLNAKGYVTEVDEVVLYESVATAAKDGIVALTVDGWKTYNENTVVYVVENGKVETVDITKLAAGEHALTVTYVQKPTGGDSDMIAQIIAVPGEVEVTPVTSVDELKAAVAAGGEIVLVSDVTLDEVLTISEDVTIKANEGVTITTVGGDLLKVTGTLTLGENVTIEGNSSILWAYGGTVNIDGATLTSDASANRWALGFAEAGGKINLKSGSVSSVWTCLTASGAGSEINVTGGSATTESDESNALISKGGAIVTISNGTVKTGNFATLWAKETGKIVVTGGTIISGNSTISSQGTGVVEVSGGDFTGPISNYYGGELTVTGGTFDSDPSDHVAVGYVATEANGVWTVAAQ